ncbi:tRNA 2-selenouridine(34) synthase MnmH [Denitromonas ohlonensis]|uniref:tRNA 2-selenouridine(34) synthase MnmH n=2 Tax=Denitromonas TaxID=139331 RepID=A0A557RKT7_9RHOO|nr:tRNA 2-selenouridine(34) synthase MnmH [Denitromonas ohlonensis]TVO65756.1 tRNA 2-selenouridine(34) synthase MnmH [Denitromonas ohlonensis]TVO79349.1 tRNA 2-selenouridine(34) synthase MnmH [Denitromonas ohlonensis]
MKKGSATVAQLSEFDEIIDVRSPAEFADDHIPGAVNMPVLDDEQRARVGTIYKQVSPFEARRIGGALVAENLARHLLAHFQDKPKHWRPLVYCWRGGQRSGAFVTWLRMVGWDACQLEGGYKNFRRLVIDALAQQPAALDFRIIGGATGSAKTRILEALAAAGAQVLDLEGLASHKGSVLGALPGIAQPTQKKFETALHAELSRFSPDQPVYVEAESRKIGRVHLPTELMEAMRGSPCFAIDASREARIEFLLRDYAYLGDDVADLQRKLGCLNRIVSNETLARWQDYAAAHDLPALFAELVDLHYDPLYKRSQNSNYVRFGDAIHVTTDDLSPSGVIAIADAILAKTPARADAR